MKRRDEDVLLGALALQGLQGRRDEALELLAVATVFGVEK